MSPKGGGARRSSASHWHVHPAARRRALGSPRLPPARSGFGAAGSAGRAGRPSPSCSPTSSQLFLPSPGAKHLEARRANRCQERAPAAARPPGAPSGAGTAPSGARPPGGWARRSGPCVALALPALSSPGCRPRRRSARPRHFSDLERRFRPSAPGPLGGGKGHGRLTNRRSGTRAAGGRPGQRQAGVAEPDHPQAAEERVPQRHRGHSLGPPETGAVLRLHSARRARRWRREEAGAGEGVCRRPAVTCEGRVCSRWG